MMMSRLALVAISLTMLGSGAAMAQTPSQPANFGEVNLTAGFSPDPHTLQMVAGGTIDASKLGGDCRGFITDAPDYKLYYTPGSYSLYISVLAASDTTLVINDPNGNWVCNDDANGLNPLVTFNNPTSGRYDIWVGHYGGAGTSPATLNISEIGGGGGGGGGPVTPNAGLPPAFGEITLQAGFPHTVNVQAGGTIDATVVGNQCYGYIAEAPDFRVNFQTLAGILPLIFSVNSTADTTLVINDPNGNWLCNDDTNGLNPEVRINGPQAGQYDVWVGTFGAGNTQPATLQITTLGLPGKP